MYSFITVFDRNAIPIAETKREYGFEKTRNLKLYAIFIRSKEYIMDAQFAHMCHNHSLSPKYTFYANFIRITGQVAKSWG